MKQEETLILILFGLIIYLCYYYQKKIKEVEAEKKVIIPMIPGVSSPSWDYQKYMDFYLQKYQ